MPPHFKSALIRQEQQQKNAGARRQRPENDGADSSDEDHDGSAVARKNQAAYVESLFPDKFAAGAKKTSPTSSPSTSPKLAASPAPTSSAATSKQKNNNNGKKSSPPLRASAARPHSENAPAKRRERRGRKIHGDNVTRIKWEHPRQLVRKIHPVPVVEDKANYWFQEMGGGDDGPRRQPEICSLPVGSVCLIEPEHATLLHLLAWEDMTESAGAATGRVTLHVAAVRSDLDLDPSRAMAMATLQPGLGQTTMLNARLPAGCSYMLQVRYADENKKRAEQQRLAASGAGPRSGKGRGGMPHQAQEPHKVLLLLETVEAMPGELA